MAKNAKPFIAEAVTVTVVTPQDEVSIAKKISKRLLSLWCLLFLVCITSFSPSGVLAKTSCSLFLRAHSSILLLDTEEAVAATWERYKADINPQNLRAHLRATRAHLDMLGVEYSVTGPQIVINPSDRSPLNQFAARVFNRYKILSFYSPKQLAEVGCEACVEYSSYTLTLNFLNLSFAAIKAGKVTPYEFHEWRHLVEIRKYTQDRNTPLLSGELALKSEKDIKDYDQHYTMEEFLTYFSEAKSTVSLYKQKKISRAEAISHLKDNLYFLRDYSYEILEAFGPIQKSIVNSLKGNNPSKLFFNLSLDKDNKAIYKGQLGFYFTPIENNKYRVQLHIHASKFDFTLMLKEPMSFEKVNKDNIPLPNLYEFQLITERAHHQTLETHNAVIDLHNLFMERRTHSIVDYQRFLNEYRILLQPYL